MCIDNVEKNNKTGDYTKVMTNVTKLTRQEEVNKTAGFAYFSLFVDYNNIR